MFTNKLPADLTLNDLLVLGSTAYTILELVCQSNRYKIVYKNSSCLKLSLYCKVSDELTVLAAKD